MATPTKMPVFERLIPCLIKVGGGSVSVIYEKVVQLETDMTMILDSSALPFCLKKLQSPPRDIQAFLGSLLAEEGIGTYAVAEAIFHHNVFQQEAGDTFLRSNAVYGLFPFPILREKKVGGDYYCFSLFADMRGVQRAEWFNLSAYFRGGGVMGEIGVVCLKSVNRLKVVQHEVVLSPS